MNHFSHFITHFPAQFVQRKFAVKQCSLRSRDLTTTDPAEVADEPLGESLTVLVNSQVSSWQGGLQLSAAC